MSATQEADTGTNYSPAPLGLLSPVLVEPVDRPRPIGRVPLRRLIIPKAISATADAAFLLLAMGLAYTVGRVGSRSSTLSRDDYVVVALVSLPMWLLVFARYGLYASRRISGRLQEFRAIFHASVVGVALLAIGAYAFDLNVARRWVVLTLVFAVTFVWLEREFMRGAGVDSGDDHQQRCGADAAHEGSR